jgi:hypothetical protein
LLGGDSLPEREWDHAKGHKQNQVKGASKKMRFNVWINLFFHFGFNPFLILSSLNLREHFRLGSSAMCCGVY